MEIGQRMPHRGRSRVGDPRSRRRVVSLRPGRVCTEGDPPDTNQSDRGTPYFYLEFLGQNLGRLWNAPLRRFTLTEASALQYMKWIGARPLQRYSLVPAALHVSKARVLESGRSPEALVLIWTTKLYSQSSFNSVMTCERLHCGRPSYAQRNASFYRTSTSLKVNAMPISRNITKRPKSSCM
jgi:hypothetical protein